MSIPSRLAVLAAGLLVLGACGGAPEQAAAPTVTEPLVTTYDGGIHVLDGTTLQLAKDIPLTGFNRVNPAGDDRHVLVSTSTGFQVLDAAAATLTDVEFPGAEPGHVVRHGGRTVLFTDGTGQVRVIDPATFGTGTPNVREHTTPEPHHGVAVELANGELVTTIGNEEERPGIVVLDAQRREIARNEDCPGVHGEATAQGEAVVIGCETGALVYRDGVLTKITSRRRTAGSGTKPAPTPPRSPSATTSRTSTPSSNGPPSSRSSTRGTRASGWSTSARATPSARWPAARRAKASYSAPTGRSM